MDSIIIKHIPFFTKQPENAEKIFKEKLEVIDLNKNEKIVFFDGSAIQNEPNSSKSVSKKGNKNLAKKNPYKFKVNALGSIALMGNSSLTISETSKAHDIARAFIDIKIANTDITILKLLLNKVLLDSDLSPDQIQQKISEKNSTKEDFINKIMKNINNNELTTVELASKLEKQSKKENLDNQRRIDSTKRQVILENISKEEIKRYSYLEPKINIILDNYSVHKSQFVKEICEILNMNLIYLPPYSPQFNPIEQVWRTCKIEIKRKYYESKEKLEKFFVKTYFKVVNGGNFFNWWEKTFLKKVL